MGTAKGEYDAARLLLVLNNEELEYLKQALLDTPSDARLAAAVAEKERMRSEFIKLIYEARDRLEREGGAEG